MFSLFKKKEPALKITDLVFATKDAKHKALTELAKKEGSITFIAWFEESREKLQQYFDSHQVDAKIIDHHELHHKNQKLIFIEHYPLAEKERNLFATLPEPPTIYSSLDEAFFQLFGGDAISSLLSKLGLDDNEAISHTMITKSIYKAQEKLAAKVTIDQSARSIEDWIKKNIGSFNA